ncbi:MAG: DNRLRE domain-containing protein, partial [candidate division KSB1 bacterium]|nr:DNRLRE domain-containing protein [candidate division KSB1 bacterium]
MMKKALVFCVVMLLSISVSVWAGEITTAVGKGADTYLSNDGQQRTGYDFTANGTHGGEPSLKVRSLVGVRMKLAYMRFDISQLDKVQQVQLGLYPVWYKGAEACTLSVYAMVNESLDNWDEMTICYNNAPGFVPFPTVPLGYYDLTGDLVKVTEMYFQKQFYTDSVYFYSEPSAAMDNFINSDTNGLVTFAVIAKDSPPGPDHDWDFGAKENSMPVAPKLVFVEAPPPVQITTADGNGADTYLSNDGQQRTGYDFTANGTHGGEPSLKVRSLVGVRMKLAYMRFDISQIGDMEQVQLGLYPVWYKGAEACTLNVYAMVNESLDNWDEM